MRKFNEWLENKNSFDHNVSDSEHLLTRAQRLSDECYKALDELADCLAKFENLENEAWLLHDFIDKAGISRLDTQGRGDADYMEEAAISITSIAKPMRVLFGKRKNYDNLYQQMNDRNQAKDLEDKMNQLIHRLNADFEQK
jgi:uncharacterized protein YerC